MWVRAALLVVLVACALIGVVYFFQSSGSSGPEAAAPKDTSAGETPADGESEPPYRPIPVALNRGPEVLDGFKGEVHPLLSGSTRLDVKAEWTPVGPGRDELHKKLHPSLYGWFAKLRPAVPQRTYTERDFSFFLPDTVGEVGQMWALDADKMLAILKQFHARPSMHVVATGRRAGPDGAFAILRAVSPSYLDIAFRVHAEFYLTPDDWPANQPHFDAWYTPAYLSGRVLVNRQTGTVDYFRFGLATEKALNVHLTVVSKGLADGRHARDIVRVERMELTGGDGAAADKVPWTTALTQTEAERRLAKVFFRFLEVDYLPFDKVLAEARRLNRPIFAVVSWGAFDDESC